MPTSTDHHAPERDVPTRSFLRTRASAVAILAASLATLGVGYVMIASAGDDPIQVQSIPAQPNTVSQWVAAPLPSAPKTAPKPAPPQPSIQPPTPALAMDAQGYVDSARCDSRERAVAIARTARATMVICEGADGTYEYQGIRLRDGASLQLDDVRPMAAGYEARNEGTTYRLSPTELVVLSGEALQSRDAILDYRVG